MKKLTQGVFGLLFCSVTTPSLALDLKQALELAQQYDTTFQAAFAGYLAASEASTQSTSAVLPQLGFNAYYQRGDTENDRDGTVTKSENNSDGYSLNLNQVIFDKTTFDNLDQGDALVAKAVADLEVAKQDTIVRVATAYFEVLTAIDTLETATAERVAIGKQLEQSTERFNVGLSAITDVKEQQASYDVSKADEIIAINDLSNKREALRFIINTYPENLKVADEEMPLVIPEPMNIDAWVDKSMQNNFSILSANYSLEAAQSAYDGSKGGHYPTLSLNASYGVNSIGERDFGIGTVIPPYDNTDTKVILNLDVPIYSGGLTSSTVRQRASERDQAQALLEQERRRTTGLARSAYLSLEADIANVKARKQAVISTQTSLDATLAGYDAGTRTSVDVLLSQRQLFSAQRDYSVARYTYLSNSLRLKQVAGILKPEDIDAINQWLIERPARDDLDEQPILSR
ncbi:MAG: TolC family outer membrane protein [Gammaproteobacteria bacterium]|nr:TolC family outer membrane protein [Gammaproteobacteria bacterium]NNJ48830.1 TolC family outer membrane protein [Gammaproteobacteria bacterium]